MAAHEEDQTIFYKLIGEQRKDGNRGTTYLTVNEQNLTTNDEIRETSQASR